MTPYLQGFMDKAAAINWRQPARRLQKMYKDFVHSEYGPEYSARIKELAKQFKATPSQQAQLIRNIERPELLDSTSYRQILPTKGMTVEQKVTGDIAKDLETAREAAASNFKNRPSVKGTGKFDTYKKWWMKQKRSEATGHRFMSYKSLKDKSSKEWLMDMYRKQSIEPMFKALGAGNAAVAGSNPQTISFAVDPLTQRVLQAKQRLNPEFPLAGVLGHEFTHGYDMPLSLRKGNRQGEISFFSKSRPYLPEGKGTAEATKYDRAVGNMFGNAYSRSRTRQLFDNAVEWDNLQRASALRRRFIRARTRIDPEGDADMRLMTLANKRREAEKVPVWTSRTRSSPAYEAGMRYGLLNEYRPKSYVKELAYDKIYNRSKITPEELPVLTDKWSKNTAASRVLANARAERKRYLATTGHGTLGDSESIADATSGHFINWIKSHPKYSAQLPDIEAALYKASLKIGLKAQRKGYWNPDSAKRYLDMAPADYAERFKNTPLAPDQLLKNIPENLEYHGGT